jgi:hypothetical protein
MEGSVPLLPASSFLYILVCRSPQILHTSQISKAYLVTFVSFAMTKSTLQRSRGSSFIHRHRSSSVSEDNSRSTSPKRNMFEGTSAVIQTRKVAVQRIIEVHDALELKHQADAFADAQRKDSAHVYSDHLDLEFDIVGLPDSEVRAFRYLLRKWDHNENPDPEFDSAVQSSELDFDEAATKHFIQRVALWHEAEETLQAMRRETERKLKKDKRRDMESALGRLLMKERRGSPERSTSDKLKEVTTREGLAQLLWTLMHDQTTPLAPELVAECTKAVRQKYGIMD